MRRLFSKFVGSLVVVALATPASVLSAAGPEDTVDRHTVVTEGTSSEPAAALSLRTATGRAAASIVKGPSSRATAAARSARTPRAQMGGGKGAMVMSLVYTAVGLGASVYMYKMIQERTAEANNDQ